MCGINGILRLSPDAPPIDREELLRTRDQMASRGPDGEGLWLDASGLAALGHRRLAVIDLSPGGAQPMASADGRYHITYNGEIYNYRELRAELSAKGIPFRSESDTEVILALFAREGVQALARLRGMFALAIWDAETRSLLLARDPLGIKPVYYAVADGVLRFASQVKALLASGMVRDHVDSEGLAAFLLWGSVPEPLTIRRAVRALPAGHALLVVEGAMGEPRALPPPAAPEAADPAAAVEDSVRAHLVADVPVGIFLSAGLDSGLVAALACRHASELVTFTLTFDAFAGSSQDEGPLAAQVARALGTRHVERRVGHEEFLALWPRALAAMDQPSIDGFNSFVVSHAAHAAGLKVVLSGLGGDEVFGSYPSFRDVPRWARWARRGRRVPALAAVWPGLAHVFQPRRPKLAGLLAHGTSLPGAYFLRRGLFLPEELPRLMGRERAEGALAVYEPVRHAGECLRGTPDDAWRAVQRMETSHYLRNQLLRDADWASMAHSLELRVPLVDARLSAELAAGDFEPSRSFGKAAFVRRAAPELPEGVFHRPKSGFAIPALALLDADSRGSSEGAASRRLALRVLEGLGIPVEPC